MRAHPPRWLYGCNLGCSIATTVCKAVAGRVNSDEMKVPMMIRLEPGNKALHERDQNEAPNQRAPNKLAVRTLPSERCAVGPYPDVRRRFDRNLGSTDATRERRGHKEVAPCA